MVWFLLQREKIVFVTKHLQTILNNKPYETHPDFYIQLFEQGITVTVNGSRTQKHSIRNFFISHFVIRKPDKF